MKWVTRERPKTDRGACPWLISRFIDAEAEILYVPPLEVLAVAQQEQALRRTGGDLHSTHLPEESHVALASANNEC